MGEPSDVDRLRPSGWKPCAIQAPNMTSRNHAQPMSASLGPAAANLEKRVVKERLGIDPRE